MDRSPYVRYLRATHQAISQPLGMRKGLIAMTREADTQVWVEELKAIQRHYARLIRLLLRQLRRGERRPGA